MIIDDDVYAVVRVADVYGKDLKELRPPTGYRFDGLFKMPNPTDEWLSTSSNVGRGINNGPRLILEKVKTRKVITFTEVGCQIVHQGDFYNTSHFVTGIVQWVGSTPSRVPYIVYVCTVTDEPIK